MFRFLDLYLLTLAVVPNIFGTTASDSVKVLPPIYLGEPISNEGTNLLNDVDGSIKFIYRKGDWDFGGFSDEIYSMETWDEGRTWTEPEVLCNTGRGSQCFSTISPETGEVIIFYIHRDKGLKGNYKYLRTDKNRRDNTHNRW